MFCILSISFCSSYVNLFSKKHYKFINNQTKAIKFENLKTICDILECTPNDLFDIYHKPNSETTSEQ
ncbi:MAG: helix-turn-helix transcriptional regulator [Clostridia bacterium]|nr:helix-turn-helix transcriptional regulator [Clostridia bacterium]